MEKFIIDFDNKNDFNAGKARVDIQNILVSLGYKMECININSLTNFKKFIIIENNIYNKLKDIINKIPSNSEIIIQYPWLMSSYRYAKFFKKMKFKKNLNLTVIIHDLNSIRTNSLFGKLYYDYIIKEFKFLNVFDNVICHNEYMKSFLKKFIPQEKLVSLNIFDYILNYTNKINSIDFNSVTIAGNLNNNKANYLSKLNELQNYNYHFNLYGDGYNGINNDFIRYKGSFESEILPKEINSGFGLVWDGPSIKTCQSKWGKYLRLNNPHKFSLYVACGIPVIIWDQAALSDFVSQNKIGFVISSLTEIEDIIANINNAEYNKLINNVSKIQNKVINGEFLKEALNKRKNYNL